MQRLFPLALILTLVLSLVPSAWAQPLPADERNVTGKFDNGLAYVVRPHANPPGRVWVYLHIRSGALNESASQNGLAHFLEHMAFNGSRNFPAGTLIPKLNQLGMQFGADTNAHTAWTETVYKLNLPDARPETLELAMKIMGDYADGLLLSDAELDRERQVILEESRSRKSVEERMQKRALRELFAGSKLSTHDVIGDEKIITTAPRGEFVDYYDTWYRPDLMTLIVVGDVTPDAVLAAARPHLGSFKPRGELREPADAGLQPTRTSRAIIFTDREQVAGEVGILRVADERPPVTTYEQFRERTLEQIANWIVSRRLQELVQTGKASFRGATVGTFDFANDAVLHSADASGQPEDWNEMLEQLVAEVNRGVKHGFTDRELSLARAELLSGAEHAVQTESTLDAGLLVDRLSDAVDRGEVAISAATELEMLRRVFADLTVEPVHEAFVKGFGGDAFIYTVTLPEQKEGVAVPTPESLLAAASAAWSVPVEPPQAAAVASSILEKTPEPGEVVHRTIDEGLGITSVTFANGVVMHHKHSDFKKDQVLVRVTLPGGRIEETAKNLGISEAASAALAQPATSRLTSTQLRDLLTGKTASVSGGAGLDAWSFAVSASPKDLEVAMQVVHAMLTDARLEPAALEEWKKGTLQQIEARKTSLEMQLPVALSQSFYGGDPRFAELDVADVERVTVEASQEWLTRSLSTAAIEVAVVGDLSADDATKQVATYLGSLPRRQKDFDSLDSLRKLDRQAGPWSASLRVPTVTPKAIVMAGFRGAEERDVSQTRPLNLAAMIITDRMNERIREKEGLVYSINAFSRAGRGIEGTGFFVAAAPTDPEKAQKLSDTVLEMLRQFAETGPTEQELSTARRQIATQLAVQMKQPSFWVGQLGELTYRDRKLDYLRELPDVYQSFTAEQIRDVSRKYFVPENALTVIVAPVAAPATQPAEAARAD